MTEPLHKQIDTPGADDSEPAQGTDRTGHEGAARRHLADLRSHLSTIEDRIEELETLVDREVPGSMAERKRGGVPATVGAGRLLESLSNAQRAAGQIYALCAALERTSDQSS